MISQEKAEQLKEKLLKKKKELEAQLLKLADKDKSIKGNYKARFPDWGREEEANAEEFEEYDRTVPIEQGFELEMEKINKALEKIGNGKGYGVCEKCGKDIKLERLEIRPQASKCISCEKKD
ncbi:MAG: TraR/DksA C4-type zinc finger protein [Patescibacteria group bacterium]